MAKATKKAQPPRPKPRPLLALPRDVVRLGLPAAALVVADPAERPPGGLLVAAGLLLAAAAGGSLLLGVAARSAARHA